MLFVWNFLLRIGLERNETKRKFVFLSLSRPFPTNFCLKRSQNCIFLIFWIFLQFFMNFLLRVRLERNWMIICIFPIYQSIPTYYGLKWSHNGIFKFSEFFSYFFGIFYYVSDWNGVGRFFLFSPFISVSPLILAWNEAIIVFYDFLNFFVICLEFSITHWVGTKRNETIIFIFISFSAISNQFLLEKKP